MSVGHVVSNVAQMAAVFVVCGMYVCFAEESVWIFILEIPSYSRRAQVILESERAEQSSVAAGQTVCQSSCLLSSAPWAAGASRYVSLTPWEHGLAGAFLPLCPLFQPCVRPQAFAPPILKDLTASGK